MTVIDIPERWDELTTTAGSGSTSRRDEAGEGRVAAVVAAAGADPRLRRPDEHRDGGGRRPRLTPLYAAEGPAREDALTKSTELTDLLGIGDVHQLDLDRTWRPRPPRDRLRVPIGVGADGGSIDLDIKESAQQGMGPHGLRHRRDRLRQVRAAAHPGPRRWR